VKKQNIVNLIWVANESDRYCGQRVTLRWSELVVSHTELMVVRCRSPNDLDFTSYWRVEGDDLIRSCQSGIFQPERQ